MTPAEHNEIQQPTLKAFLDNELSWWRQFAVRLHLARCASCREELRAMQQIGKELRTQTTLDPLDPGLRARILATVQEMTPQPPAPVPSRRPVLIWGGAAFAALLLVAVFASRPEFAPASRSMFAPDMQKVEAPAAATSPRLAAPATPLNAYAPQEVEKPARASSPSESGTPAQSAPVVGDALTGPTAYKQERPEMQAKSSMAQIPPTQTPASDEIDSMNALRPANEVGGRRSTAGEAKKANSAPMVEARASAAQDYAKNMPNPTYGGARGGASFGHRQKRAADAASVDRLNLPQQRVVLERAGFDLNGYQFVTQGGQKIAVAFHKSLNAVRFARATDGKMALDETSPVPVLYLSPADWLVNDAVPGARWQPLPPNLTVTQPLYVRPASDWEQFTGMRWYPNMTVVGGLSSLNAADGGFAWLSGSHVQIGATLYPDFAAYRAFADGHPDALRLNAVYNHADAPVPALPPTPHVLGTPPASDTPKNGAKARSKSTP